MSSKRKTEKKAKSKKQMKEKVKTRPKRRPRFNTNTATRLARRFERSNDCVVEGVPRFTQHAKQRLQEGRQGSYVCKPNRGKIKKRMYVVTVLPYGHDHNIPSVHANARRKSASLKNKCKQLVKSQYVCKK